MIREPYIKQRIPRKYFAVLFFTLAFFVGIIFYVFQKKASSGFDYLNNQLVPPRYLENPEYCMEGKDCAIFHELCSSKTINKYNFDAKLDKDNLKKRVFADCDPVVVDFTSAKCENNLCVGE